MISSIIKQVVENHFYKIIIAISIMITLLIIENPPFYVLDPGYSAIHLRLGGVVRCVHESGFYMKAPLIDNVIRINTRICKSVIETSALTKDLQSVSIGVAINYRISNPVALYNTIGIDFERIVIDPYAQESIKAIVAKFTAEDLIQHRHSAKEMVYTDLKERLEPLYLNLIDFNFVHSDFSHDFIRSVELKQIAEQNAKTEHNNTKKVQEQVIQNKERSDGEAYALKVKRESVTPELIEMRRAEAMIEAINKWDGKLPHIITATTPLMNIDKI